MSTYKISKHYSNISLTNEENLNLLKDLVFQYHQKVLIM